MMGRAGNNLIDQQTQTPGDGVSVALRTQLKNATRNIKNRWSSSGGEVGVAGIMGGNPEEVQALLAVPSPNDTPTHPQQLHMMHDRNVHRPDMAPPPYPPSALPPTSQLQRAINHTLRSSGDQSNKLSRSQDPLSSVKAETIC